MNHSKLIDKLAKLDIDRRSIAWITSYLSIRTFCVKVNNSFSVAHAHPAYRRVPALAQFYSVFLF